MDIRFNEALEKIWSKLDTWLESGLEMLPNFAIAVIVVVVFGLTGRLVHRLVQRGVMRWSNNEPISALMGRLARISVVLIGLFIALGLLHLDKTVTSLLAGVGVLGLALGFAFQDIAANFMSGIIMAFRGHFEVGDLIEVSGHLGTVQSIELRATTIKTFQGLTVILPNRQVFQNDLINYTLTDERRVDIVVGVAYCDDLREAISAIKREVAKVEYRDEKRDPDAFVTGFGDSSINLVVHMWLDLSRQPNFLIGQSEAMIAIKRAIDEAGLTIPFPIRTLDFGGKVVGGESIADHPLRFADSGS